MNKVYILYAYDDPDNAPILTTGKTPKQCWDDFNNGFLYVYDIVNKEAINEKFVEYR